MNLHLGTLQWYSSTFLYSYGKYALNQNKIVSMTYSDDDSYELYEGDEQYDDDYDEQYEEYYKQYEKENVQEVPSTSVPHHITFGIRDDGYSYSHMYGEDIRTYSSRSKIEQVKPKESSQYLSKYWRLNEEVWKSFKEKVAHMVDGVCKEVKPMLLP